MSFLTMLDHRAIVYRAGVSRDRFGGTVETWEPLVAPAGKNARPNQNVAGSLVNPGPGEIQAGSETWFLHPDFDVEERDVLRVIAGPEAPEVSRVVAVSKPTNPYGVHHIEVITEPWSGSLS